MPLAQLPLSDTLLKQLIDMGTVGIILALVLIGAVLFLAITRRERAGDKEANQNTSALITVVGELSKGISKLNERELEKDATNNRLADALTGLSKTTGDYQKLVDGTLSLMRESVDELNKRTDGRVSLIHADIENILRKLDELKTDLDKILRAIETKEMANNGKTTTDQ